MSKQTQIQTQTQANLETQTNLETHKETLITNDLRKKIKSTLTSKLGPDTSANLSEQDLEELEEGIYTSSILMNPLKSHIHAYTSQAKMIYLHLSPDSYIKNTYLLESIKNKTLKIRNLGSMNECDMNPSKWQGSLSKLAEAKQVSHGAQVVASDIIKCRCGGQTTFTEQQTRSSDEAMTIKATCLKCGKRFNI